MASLERLRACYLLQVHITSKCVLLHLLLLKSRSLSDVVYLLAVVSTMGSCACFGLSRLIGKALAHALWPERLQAFRQEVSDVPILGTVGASANALQCANECAACQVERRKGDLLSYIVILRITPVLPNIFINIASPVVNVPIGPFALGE